MSFEEAATIPLAYATAVHSMFSLGNLQEGQSVLIHSGASGAGLDAVQLAKQRKAHPILFAVKDSDKQTFLSKTFGIPKHHIFMTSCTTTLTTKVMREAGGRGMDLVLDSVTSELLDASWNVLADGGSMVNFRKVNATKKVTLAMAPFQRNCSFRTVDFSSTGKAEDLLVETLLDKAFALVDAGRFGPSHPIVRYGFDEVSAALIIGGLKGLCGSPWSETCH